MTRSDFEYIKDAFSQIIDDIAGNPDWHDATRAVASEIGTLEKLLEKRVVVLPNDLEEAAIQYATHKKKSEEKEMETELPMGAYYLAKDSFTAGAKWQENKVQETIKLAEDHAFLAGADWQKEHTPLPEDTVLFNKGVEEGKRLMMEDAVEGEFLYTPYPTIALDDCKDYNFKDNQKVRIIIVMEN